MVKIVTAGGAFPVSQFRNAISDAMSHGRVPRAPSLIISYKGKEPFDICSWILAAGDVILSLRAPAPVTVLGSSIHSNDKQTARVVYGNVLLSESEEENEDQSPVGKNKTSDANDRTGIPHQGKGTL
jgi:hypothetical protein